MNSLFKHATDNGMGSPYGIRIPRILGYSSFVDNGQHWRANQER